MKSYLESSKPEACYGCRACEQACPKKAIDMLANSEGFLYPTINQKLCIHCNICVKVCPVDVDYPTNVSPEVFAMQSLNLEDLMNSSSGGAFIEISRYILSVGGLICGCIFDDNMVARHVLTDEWHVIKRMQGSKYVQSDTASVYISVKKALKAGKLIAFFGTPCQCQGLRTFIGDENAENLLIVDLICHGVPSQLLFTKYLDWLSTKEGWSCTDYRFREKRFGGWGNGGAIVTSSRIFPVYPDVDPYYYLFYYAASVYRESCYQCKYANGNRIGDITIGDYWGVRAQNDIIDTERGVSVVICNTNIGKALFAKLSTENFIKIATSFEDASRENANLRIPTPRPSERDTIYEDLYEKGFQYLVKEYCKLFHIKPRIRRMIPKPVIKVLRDVKRRIRR